LFDLESDPLERVNLAGERPDLVRELSAKVADWSCRPRSAAVEARPEWDNEAKETLRALGYIE
jgi:hypothetical protein